VGASLISTDKYSAAMPDPDLELLAKARPQTPTDPAVRDCWRFIVRAIEVGWVDADEIIELLGYLRAATDFTVEELSFWFAAGKLTVSFLGERVECSAARLIRELEMLVA
jgi:hypothetical protein